MQHVFGPVPSRRLGRSLGIDPIPLKTCNWNCVYCQLGRTVPLTNRRAEYVPRGEILEEVQQALRVQRTSGIDWITFVGSGEPTLHGGLGVLIRDVKKLTQTPVAVITNGALLYLPRVRRELGAADAVLPTLDAGSPRLHRRINRPHPWATYERLVSGLAAFRRQYGGQLWVEVMLVRGLNDTQLALQEIAAVLRRVRPDEVHVNLPVRPPAEAWVQPPDDDGLTRALSVLGEVAKVVSPAEGDFEVGGSEKLTDAVVAIITRHPMRQDELERMLARLAPGQVNEVLSDLLTSGRAQVVERHGTRFWSARGARFPDAKQSRRAMPGGSRETPHRQQ